MYKKQVMKIARTAFKNNNIYLFPFYFKKGQKTYKLLH